MKSSDKEYVVDPTLAKEYTAALADLHAAALATPMNFNMLAYAVKVAHASTSAALAALP